MGVSTKKAKVGFWRWAWRVLAATFATCVVILAIAVGLFRVILPLVPDYQARIERAATAALGLPLELGAIDARWRLRGPELVFDTVRVLTPESDEVLLDLQRCRVVISVSALIRHQEIRPTTITLSGAQLELVRRVDGTYTFQGYPVSALMIDQATPMTQNLASWILPDGEFELRNIDLTFEDKKNNFNAIRIPDIDLVMKIEGKQLDIDGDLQPSAEYQQRIDFSLRANGRASEPRKIQWQGFVDANEVNMESIIALLPPDNFPSTTEPLTLRLWVSALGEEIDEINFNVDAKQIGFPGNASLAHLKYDRIAGNVTWLGDDKQWRLTVNELLFASEGAVDEINTNSLSTLPRGNIPHSNLIVTMNSNEGKQTLDYAIDYFDLGAVTTLLSMIPQDAQWLKQEWLKQWKAGAPLGILSQIQGSIVFEPQGIVDFNIDGEVKNLSWRSVDEQPGITGIDAKVFGSRASGGIDIFGENGHLEIPQVLREAVVFDVANLAVRWQLEPSTLTIAVADIDIGNADIHVGGIAELIKDIGSDAWSSDISLHVDRLDLKSAKKYFPVNQLKPRLLRWLDNALLAGQGSDGRFRLKGPLAKFPFENPADGEFMASINLQDAILNYDDQWPQANGLDARLEFVRNGLNALVERAQIMSLSLDNGQVMIDSFDSPVIEVEGQLLAELDNLRAYLDATPLVADWGDEWPRIEFTGAGNTQIQLELDPNAMQTSKYDIAVQFSNTQLSYRDWPQRVSQLRGLLNIKDQGISASQLEGVFLDGPITINAKPVAIGSFGTHVEALGQVSDDGLRRHFGDTLGNLIDGSAEWGVDFVIGTERDANQEVNQEVNQDFELRLQSPMTGMKVVLPQPLGKPAQDTRFTTTLLKIRDDDFISAQIEYGSGIHVVADLVHRDAWRIHRGEMRLGGSTATLPTDPIVRIIGSSDALDMSEYISLTEDYGDSADWLNINQINVQVAQLSGFGQAFGATNVTMEEQNDGTQFFFQGEGLTGQITVPQATSPQTPIVAELEMLAWHKTEAQEPLNPADVPSFKLSVDNFIYDEYRLGSLTMHVEARDNIVAVREFATQTESFTTNTTGSWVFGGESESTYLVSELRSTNLRETLKELNRAELADSESAVVKAELSWPQGWTNDYLETVEGQISFEVREGQLHSVDPGAGRVFGLLSLAALPRRLSLDFRDVFGSGFAFDSIAGDFTIREGNAYTENMALRGPAAHVGVVGRAGLAARDYDQTAIVYANFGSTLPIAGAIAGGPAVGAALLLFSEIFKAPLRQMGRVTYSISGSWDDPQFVRTGSARASSNDHADGRSDGTTDDNTDDNTDDDVRDNMIDDSGQDGLSDGGETQAPF